jgi:hypothetical protein
MWTEGLYRQLYSLKNEVILCKIRTGNLAYPFSVTPVPLHAVENTVVVHCVFELPYMTKQYFLKTNLATDIWKNMLLTIDIYATKENTIKNGYHPVCQHWDFKEILHK